MSQFLKELSTLSPATLAAIVAFAGAFGAVVSAVVTSIIGKLFVSPFLSGRDRLDREVEWRKHAIELTKLDLDRKIKTRSPSDTTPLRPSILDFLANYRDLQELGKRSPKEVYQDILNKRINQRPADLPTENSPIGNAGQCTVAAPSEKSVSERALVASNQVAATPASSHLSNPISQVIPPPQACSDAQQKIERAEPDHQKLDDGSA